IYAPLCVPLDRTVEASPPPHPAAGDGGELAADLIHAMLQGFPAVGIIDFAPGAGARGILPAITARPGLHRLGVMGRGLQPIRRGAERGSENLEIAEADIAGLADADKGTAFPAAPCVGGVADAELLLLDQRRLHLHFGCAVIDRSA